MKLDIKSQKKNHALRDINVEKKIIYEFLLMAEALPSQKLAELKPPFP